MMEQLEQQRAVLELGKLLVRELDIENSVDTLSRWMAHYVAEKIIHAESLTDKVEKKDAESECFTLILELWKHRWHYPSERQPLRNFNNLYDILESLDPDKDDPFFFPLYRDNSDSESKSFKPTDLKNLSSFANQVDKVARIWISYLLQDAALKTKNEKILKIIDRLVNLTESKDTQIIKIVFNNSIHGIDKQDDQAELDRKNKINILKLRIGELNKFKKVNEYLIAQYENELNKLNK